MNNWVRIVGAVVAMVFGAGIVLFFGLLGVKNETIASREEYIENLIDDYREIEVTLRRLETEMTLIREFAEENRDELRRTRAEFEYFLRRALESKRL